jgi:PAS domain-containing protein
MQSISTEPNPYVIALFALESKDGHEVEISFFAKEIELEGKPVILVISERDKEAFKRYEADFRSEEGLTSELHSAWDFIINKDGQIIAANPAGVLGYLPEDSIGSNLSHYIEEGELKENFLRGVGSEFSYVGRGRMKNSKGEFINVEVAFTADHLSKEGDSDISVSLIKL